jgi:ankyrin repeat protein
MMKDPSWDLNESIGDSGRTPIYIASQNGHAVIVDLLLRAGADKDCADEDDTTPITIASFNGHAAVVELLLRAGADMDKSDEDGAGPLHVACQADHKVVVEILLRAGADTEKAKKDGATPLYIAAQSCNVGLVELLLEHGASVFTARANGWMPISAAADRGHIELCELLCAAAIASTHPDDGKKTIHLQGCHIRDASAQALSKALKADWSVSALDLSGNEIQDAGAVALAEALAVNPNLTTLDLSDNLIGDTGAQALADALAASGHIHRSIHLGSNRLRKEGKQSLSRALESTVCVIVGVTGLNEEALAINISLDSLRKTVVKPRIRSLSALLVDPKDFDLADVVKDLLKMTTRALTAVL